MTPLQRIAIGMVVVAIPANFGSECHAYDALPDPIGWLIVLSGIAALARTQDDRTFDLDWARWSAVLALLVSVPLWLPQVNSLLIPDCTSGVQDSARWALSLPPFLFGLALCRTVGQAGQHHDPRDAYVAGRFGILTWAFAACLVLPAIGYGAHEDSVLGGAFLLIGLVQVVFIYYLFRVHARPWLGGPALADGPDARTAAPEEPERPS